MMSDTLTRTLGAIADPTRRKILSRLGEGTATVTEIAEPFELSMPAISKHLKVLETARLIERSVEAQWRPCTLRLEPLLEVADWVEEFRQIWEDNFDGLDQMLTELQKTRSDRSAT